MMIAVVAEAPRGRLYLPASNDLTQVAASAAPAGYPETDLPDEALGFRVQKYGIRKHWQMFTARQLTAMVTLSDLVKESTRTCGVTRDCRRLRREEIRTPIR